MLGWSADAVPNLAVVETVDSVKVSVTAAFVACSSFDTLVAAAALLLAAIIVSVCYCTSLIHCAAYYAQSLTLSHCSCHTRSCQD